MRNPAFLILALVMALSLPAFAGSFGGVAADGASLKAGDDNVTVLVAQGFAFQGKEFKTVKLGIKYAAAGKSDSSNGKTSASAAGNPDGWVALGGFEYALKIVAFEDGKVAADLFRPADFESNQDKKQDRLRLPVPVGHMSINRSQPSPGNMVYLGTLRLNDEETSIDGEFELYLNDHSSPDIGELKDLTPKMR